MRPARTLFLITLVALGLVACGADKKTKPPERIVNVTTATVQTRDLPVTESAVGMETALGMALAYDPTRTRGGTFYVRLPFPEHVAARLRPGQSVALSDFAQPDKTVSGTIREIRPALSATTLSRDVIVAVTNSAWQPSGSIRGEVTLGVNRGARVVPEQAVVLRPKGSVVYGIADNVAREQPVTTGIIRDGLIEIRSGVEAGETVVVDGAALLSNGAKVQVRAAGTEAPAAPAKP